VARRRMVLRHIDPFSVLKFGAVANLAVAAIGLVALSLVTRVVLGSGLVDQACDIASDVGFLNCGVSQGAVTRLLLVLAIVWAVVQTALLVLLAFLHNLIADLTGGITVTMEVDAPAGTRARPAAPAPTAGGQGPTATPAGGPAATPLAVPARPGPAGPDTETTTVETVDAIEAVVPPRPSQRRGTPGGTLFGGR